MSNVEEHLNLLSELASDMTDDETKACVLDAEISLRAYIFAQAEANAKLKASNKRLHQHVSFYHRWATRTNVTDGERLGVIKHYPLTEEEIAALAQEVGE